MLILSPGGIIKRNDTLSANSANRMQLHTHAMCVDRQPENAYIAGMWHHRHDVKQRTLCQSCSRPRCTAEHCKTCPSCRNPSCTKTTKRSHCTDAITALNPQQLPTTMEEVRGFLCDKCRFITCMRIDSQGKRCGKEMPKKAKARLPKNPKQTYICGICQTLDTARASLRGSRQ